METATSTPARSGLAVWLAGLQSGMMGVLALLAWLGLSSKMQRRSFWTPENLMASAFFGERALVNGFQGKTLSGLALYLFIYSALGAVFAAVLSNRQSRGRVLLLSLVYALGWYYFSFNILWKNAAPLLWLLYSAQPMILGHLVYGTFLGQYPAHLPKAAVVAAVAETPAEAQLAESQESNPGAPV